MSTQPILSYATPRGRVWPLIIARVFLIITGTIDALIAVWLVATVIFTPNESLSTLEPALFFLAGAIVFHVAQLKIGRFSRPWFITAIVATILQSLPLILCPTFMSIAFLSNWHSPDLEPGDRLGFLAFLAISGFLFLGLYLPQLVLLILVRRHFKKHPQG